MRLGGVLDDGIDLGEHAELEIDAVEIDSRRCSIGTLFFAMPGLSSDGALFVDDAVSRGASAIVTSRSLSVPVPSWTVALEDLHPLLVRASANVVRHPERRLRLCGVTGTNGKTSVTTTLAALWREMGHASDVIGTLTHERTTPASPELYRELARIAASGREGDPPLAALEVSSHALSQGRVDGLIFDVAVFTNLSLDHLDYHGTMEAYFEAKASLFVPERCERAVVWVDDDYGRRLAQRTNVPLIEVRRSDASDVALAVGSTSFSWRGHKVHTRLSGEYNLDNALLVLASAVEMGASEFAAAAAFATVPPVPGRFEVVSSDGPTVVVDYAHTPDGLARLLRDVRWLSNDARVIVVFGCGGDRDRTKRPVMGEVATELADLTILTSDNPRSENPESIIDEIAAGCLSGASWRRQSDRRGAIADALGEASARDVVVIAGKGHETTQTLGERVIDFDDRQVARELLGVRW